MKRKGHKTVSSPSNRRFHLPFKPIWVDGYFVPESETLEFEDFSSTESNMEYVPPKVTANLTLFTRTQIVNVNTPSGPFRRKTLGSNISNALHTLQHQFEQFESKKKIKSAIETLKSYIDVFICLRHPNSAFMFKLVRKLVNLAIVYSSNLFLKGYHLKAFEVIRDVESELKNLQSRRTRVCYTSLIANSLANFFLARKKPNAALKYANQGLDLWKKLEDISCLFYYLLKAATANMFCGNYKRAGKQFDIILNFAVQETRLKEILKSKQSVVKVHLRATKIDFSAVGNPAKMILLIAAYNNSLCSYKLKKYKRAELMSRKCQEILDELDITNGAHPWIVKIRKTKSVIDNHTRENKNSVSYGMKREHLVNRKYIQHQKAQNLLFQKPKKEKKRKQLNKLFPTLKYDLSIFLENGTIKQRGPADVAAMSSAGGKGMSLTVRQRPSTSHSSRQRVARSLEMGFRNANNRSQIPHTMRMNRTRRPSSARKLRPLLSSGMFAQNAKSRRNNRKKNISKSRAFVNSKMFAERFGKKRKSEKNLSKTRAFASSKIFAKNVGTRRKKRKSMKKHAFVSSRVFSNMSRIRRNIVVPSPKFKHGRKVFVNRKRMKIISDLKKKYSTPGDISKIVLCQVVARKFLARVRLRKAREKNEKRTKNRLISESKRLFGKISRLIDNALKENHSPVVITGIEGVGKSTVIQKIRMMNPDLFGFPVYTTNRRRKEFEIDKIDFHFVSLQSIEKSQNDFVLLKEFFPYHFGLTFSSVKSVLNAGKGCIIECSTSDVNGVVNNLKKKGVSPLVVVVRPPPNFDLYKERLIDMGNVLDDSVKLICSKGKVISKKLEVFPNYVRNDTNVEHCAKNIINMYNLFIK